MAERFRTISISAGTGRARGAALAAVSAGLLLLGACAHGSPGSLEYDGKSADGGSGAVVGGGKDGKGVAVGVNSYLWRASLDTISFMPLASADPYGGIIITDWYANQGAANERFKLTVYILDQQLRSDALKVAVFKQVKGPGGAWVDAPADARTGPKLENAILTRAREMRITSSDK